MNSPPSEMPSGWHPSQGRAPAQRSSTGQTKRSTEQAKQATGQASTIARWAMVPTKQAPVKQVPTKQAPTKQAPVKQAAARELSAAFRSLPPDRHPAAGFQLGRRGAGAHTTQPPKVGRAGLRLALLLGAMILFMGILAGRLFQVQVLERSRYVEFAERQGVTAREISAQRGAILDRGYNVLAISDNRPTIYADPREVANPVSEAAALATVLDIDQARIAARLASDKHFVYVARQVSPALGEQVMELDLPGIGLTYESTRIRPNGDRLARGVLGTVDVDQKPTAGAEVQFADELDGTNGLQVAAISRDGIPLPSRSSVFEPPTPGDDVVLSLNTEIQWMVEQALLEAVDEYEARGATAVLMEVRTGDLLAISSARRNAESGEVSVTAHNPAYTDAFEPGSVAKVFSIAAALEEGVTTPDEQINATREYKYADKVFSEPFRTFDKVLTTEEVLTESSNIGTIQIAERVPSHTLHDYLRQFGFGRFTGPDHERALPGESKGILEPSTKWYGTQHATIAFGHGVSVTAVQLAAAINVIANGGEYVPPRLHLGSIDADAQFNPVDAPVPERVLSEHTNAQMVGMLSAVVEKGTGKRAAVPGYTVAGKTGTAQKVESDGAYSDTDYVSTFAGFLPAENPAISVVVLLDEPRTSHLASSVAAPLFAEITAKATRILKVAPDA